MDIVVLKFGGSSVANNENLNIVANKIIEFNKKYKNIVVVVSAQGKTTDRLIDEAKQLSTNPNSREVDALISTGEQISSSKLAIILNSKNCDAISLNAWQAGIMSDGNFQNAKITSIYTEYIIEKLKQGKIVIVTGFQGIDKGYNINTLGRGGSDTTCIALASALNAKKCYIFSDVDGVYTSDPNIIKEAKKLKDISYIEMENASFEGAKVLHDRSVELAKKYNLPIIAASTFNNNTGTKVISDIESVEVKSIIKNDKICLVEVKRCFDKNINEKYSCNSENEDKMSNKKVITNCKKNNQYKNSIKIFEELLNILEINKIKYGTLIIKKHSIFFTILQEDKSKLEAVLKDNNFKSKFTQSSKVSIIGSGISNDFKIISIISKIILKYRENIISIDNSAYKISIQFDKIINNDIIQELHNSLIK